VLAYIAQLYAVEKRSRQCRIQGEDLRLLREQGARPVLEQLHAYLLKIEEQLLPKSDAGQAVSYVLKNWTALIRYLEDGDLAIDNNHTERSLRGLAVGRNNWTFFGSDRGGKTMAILRSFVGSCELLKIDPFEWFRDVLSRIPTLSIQQLESVTPSRLGCCPGLTSRPYSTWAGENVGACERLFCFKNCIDAFSGDDKLLMKFEDKRRVLAVKNHHVDLLAKQAIAVHHMSLFSPVPLRKTMCEPVWSGGPRKRRQQIETLPGA
jgi:hypothetical protein